MSLLAALIVTAARAPHASAAADVVEVPAGTQRLVVFDASQRVYVSGGDQVTSVSFAGDVQQHLTGHPGASGMAFGGNSLFVVESTTGAIGRITVNGPAGTDANNGRFNLNLVNATDIVNTSGYLWTTTGGCDNGATTGSVVRVDGVTGTATVLGGSLTGFACPKLEGYADMLIVVDAGVSPTVLHRFDTSTDPPTPSATHSTGAAGGNLRDFALTTDEQSLVVACDSPTPATRWVPSDLSLAAPTYDVGASPTSIAVTQYNGGLVAVGHAGTSGSPDLALFRLDTGGAPLWHITRGQSITASSMDFSSNGSHLFVVSHRGDGHDDLNIIVLDDPTVTPTTTTSTTTTSPPTTTTTSQPPASHNGEFHPLDPQRISDSRAFTAYGSGEARTIQVSGLGGVPPTGVSAVALNLTVTDATRPGYVTVWPAGGPRPNASTLNYVPEQSVPNMTVVGLGSGGRISIFAEGAAHIIVDVVGWFSDAQGPPGGKFHPILPTRWFDTRLDPRGDGTVRPVGPGAQVITSFTGGAPTSSAHLTAMALNVTATNTTSESYLTVTPTGAPLGSSNLNWRAGQAVPNAVVTKVSPTQGAVSFTNAFGETDVIADAFGYWDDGTPTTGTRLQPIVPVRMADTRTGYLAPGSLLGSATRLAPYSLLSFKANGSLPAGATAVVLNITAVVPTAAGYLSAFPLGIDFDEGMQTSIVNFSAGDVRPNMAIMPVGAGGEIVIVNASAGSIDIIVDMSGFFA